MTRQYCPICSEVVQADARYPHRICDNCISKATSADGRQLTFSNADITGGFVGRYADNGEEYRCVECFIEGVRCLADEARFGGIVIQSQIATIQQLLLPFAQSIHAKARAYNDLRHVLTSNQRARMLEAISDDIKKCTNFIRPKVSRAARDWATRLGIDLCAMNWHDQPRFDPARRKFHFEHFRPVSLIRSECIEKCSETEILEILKTQLTVVWILKSEDVELRRLGYQSNRPDPDKAYREAMIELVDLGDS